MESAAISIESGVPIPRAMWANGRPCPYPWASMQPGNSFFIGANGTKPSTVASRLSNSGRSYLKSVGKDKTHMVVTRVVDGGVRVWLTARL